MKLIYLFLFLIFIIGCETEVDSSITLETDTDVYHSGEIIHITSQIQSPADINGVLVRFYGIDAGRYRLDETITTNLVKGENTIAFEYTAPSCNTCSGINPGVYNINVDVMDNQETLVSETINIEIRQ